MGNTHKKTPTDATEFDREQLRFFLTGRGSDIPALLGDLNPSLAWLPVLAQLKLINAETQLASWIEKNFAEADAIRDVAANIHFFGPDTADILEFRLNQAQELPALLLRCWRLIIRHMRTTKRGGLRDDWFDMEPRIKRGERSPELLERLALVLRPKLRVGKATSWGEETEREPQWPSDLISIDYEVEDGVTPEDVLSAWPVDVAAEVDGKLLTLLTNSLHAALEDAIDAGVEGNIGNSLSDSDVPSVAKHDQNAYRTGFLPIVRVMAELWTRLARKDPERAISFVEGWRASPMRLARRLALFAAADVAVPSRLATQILLSLPAGELFLTSSSVEVHRLIDTRWNEISPGERQAIEHRLAEGPPADWFIRDQATNVERCRFDLLGHLERSGIPLSQDAQAVLDDIRSRQPAWRLRPKDQAGFHFWHENADWAVGDPSKLGNIPDTDLVPAAKKAADAAEFMDGDPWRALTETDAPRALRGLSEQALVGEWPVWAWQPFLWAASKLQDVDDVKRVAQLLLDWPKESFPGIAATASSWLNEAAKTLDDDLLWPLWDRIAQACIQAQEEPMTSDDLTTSLNHPSGRLTEVLLRKLTKGPSSREMPAALSAHLDEIVNAPGRFGHLARIRMATDVSVLFERAPDWTQKKILPLFEWRCSEAAAAWSARRYASYIGSPELFRLTKQAFLDLFGRADASDEDIRTFADWLTAIMIANQSHRADYPINPAEARSALRKAGIRSLTSVGHRLALEMERAKPEDKAAKWREVVGPVFQSIWPLDIELQTSGSTFKLVQILRASGSAFPQAAGVITPFVRADEHGQHSSIYSISRAEDVLYASSPESMLDLVAAVIGGTPPRGLSDLYRALERIQKHAPELANTKKFQRLLDLARPG